MEKQVVGWKKVITIAGAILAFAIGSGFATGQEVLQYFASYGYLGIAGAITFFILNTYVQLNFITVGQREKFNKGSDIFQYYCGKAIGTFYDYFTVAFVFMSYVVMIAGAGATLNQHYGLPVAVGGIIMAVLAGATVIFGLGAIVDVIGSIGPLIIAATIIISLSGIIMNPGGISQGIALLPELNVMKASTNWFFAVCSYVGFGMLWFAGFLSALGKTLQSRKEATLGVWFGVGALTVTIIILTLGLLANIEQVAGSQIPLLYLAANIHPLIANLFSVIIVAGIYTTAVPLLWTVSSRFTEEKSKSFVMATIALAIVGCFIGLALPFNRLVNIIYVINGYAGFVFLAFIVVKDIKVRLDSKKTKEI